MEGNILDMGVNDNKLEVTTAGKAHLKTAAGWAKFLAIVFFVFAGLMFLLGIVSGFVGGSLASEMPDSPLAGIGSGIFGFLFYALIGTLYLFFGLYQYRFSEKSKRAIINSDSVNLEQALKNLKSYFKIQGIMMILFLALIVFAFLFGIGAAIMSGY